MREQQTADLFKVLSSGTRLRILGMLRSRALCVGALATRLDVTQGAVSQHLRILRDAGLVVADKRGNFVHYRLNERAIDRLRRAVDTVLTVPSRREAGDV